MINEYSKALFELTNNDNLDSISESFEVFMENFVDDFKIILLSPRISKDGKKDILKTCFKSCNETFVFFLLVVADNNRLNLLDEIYADFKNLVNEHKNKVYVDIYTSSELSSEVESKLKNALKVRFLNKDVILNVLINSELLGGLKIYHNGTLIDATIKNQLDVLKINL